MTAGLRSAESAAFTTDEHASIEKVFTPRHEATERIEILPVPVGEALHLARTGRIADGQSALALLLCEERLRQRGYLD